MCIGTLNTLGGMLFTILIALLIGMVDDIIVDAYDDMLVNILDDTVLHTTHGMLVGMLVGMLHSLLVGLGMRTWLLLTFLLIFAPPVATDILLSGDIPLVFRRWATHGFRRYWIIYLHHLFYWLVLLPEALHWILRNLASEFGLQGSLSFVTA
jgi:hypothetical protein